MTANDSGQPENLSRRDAIEKMGRFAAYTAPAMMVLLTSQKAMARSNEAGPGPGGGGGTGAPDTPAPPSHDTGGPARETGGPPRDGQGRYRKRRN